FTPSLIFADVSTDVNALRPLVLIRFRACCGQSPCGHLPEVCRERHWTSGRLNAAVEYNWGLGTIGDPQSFDVLASGSILGMFDFDANHGEDRAADSRSVILDQT